jgi:hypothetical protein
LGLRGVLCAYFAFSASLFTNLGRKVRKEARRAQSANADQQYYYQLNGASQQVSIRITAARKKKLHIPPVLPAHFIKCVSDLSK